MTTAKVTPTATTWPWMKDCSTGITIADPIPPVNEYDNRLSVKSLIDEYRPYIDEVRIELLTDPLFDATKHDDLWILRFLMSHKKNIDAVVKAAKYTLNLRKEHMLDDMDIRYTKRSEGFSKDPMTRYAKYCKEDAVQFALPDPKRGIVSWIRLSSIDEQVKCVDEADWLPCYLYDAEWAFQWQDYITRTTGRLTKQMRLVDLDGMTLLSMNSETSKRDGRAMGILEDCYPQALQKLYIVNAPTWINIPWRILRPLFPIRVTSKIDFIAPLQNEMERQRLLEYIALEHLPERFGGLYEHWPVAFPIQV